MSEYEDLKTIVEANQQYNVTEHGEIHDALDAERSQRIAGDAVVLEQLSTVNTRVTSVNTSLGNEVIARTHGDLVSDGLYQGLSARFILEWQDLTSQLSDLSIDVVNNANQLQGAIDTLAMSVEVLATNLRQETQDLFTQYDDRLEELDQRVAKYEIMLQDITMDSSQITMDNGEITLGAWTILSQAREWDLEIIRKMDKYQLNTTEDINQALDDIQSQLPNAGEIINQAIEALSNAPVIKDLDSKLTGAIGDINDLNQDLLGEITNRQNEMIAQAQNTANALKVQADELIANILAETTARIDAVTREADIRTLQIEGINASISEETAERIEEIRLLNDGLTAEVNSRVEGDQNITTSLDNYKESNDTALANVRNTVEVLVSDSTALSQTVSSLDARLTVTEASTATANSLAASANEKATTALTATTSLAERMESVEASIETVQGDLTNKVDVVAFNSLKTEVTAIDGKVTANTANIASITGNITDISSQLTANTTAISELSTKQTQQGNDIEQVSSQITQLSADIDSVQNAVANKADASAVASLTSQVDQQGENITLINSDITTLKGSVSTVEGDLASKADVTAFNALDSKVTTVDGKVTALNSNVISLESRVVTAEAGIATKADASALNDIYTKTESDQAIAGQITTFKSVFAQGGDNLLVNSNVDKPYIGTYPHGVYELGESWEVGATYTLLWCASFVRKSLDQNNLVLAAYAGGGLQDLQSISSEGERQVHKVTFVVRPEGTGYNTINFYLLNSNGGYLDAVATVHWAVLVKASDVLTDAWVQSKYDINNAISANAQAIRNTETAVATIDGKVTAQATELLNLNTGLTNLSNSKLDASIIQQYRTAVDQDSVTAGELTQFKSALKIGGDNLFTGTKTFNKENIESGTSSFHPNYNYFGGVTQEFLPNALFGTHTVVKAVAASWCGFYLQEADGVSWEAKEDMVLSFWANASADVHVYGIASQLGLVATITANQPMTKYEVLIPKGKPLRNASNQGIIEFNFPNGGELWYGAVMLQVGTKSTSWQPSSKESDDAYNTLATALTETNTRVGGVENGIASQANQLINLSAKLNERKMYQLYSGGLEAVTGGAGWLKGFDPNSYYDIGRSYGLVVFNGDGSIQSVNSYDVFGGQTQPFIAAVAAVPPGTYVAVLTSDEPSNNKGLIKSSLKSLGGSDAIDQVVDRGAYLLVGRKGLPTGQAIEKISNTKSFGVDYLLEMYNGVPIGLGGSSPQSDIVSNMRTEVSNIGGNITSLSETVTSHTASLSVVARGTYSKEHVLDLRGLDENLYYPVVMSLAVAPSSKLRIFRTLGSFPERPSWSTHGQGFDCKLEWSATGDGWGTTSRDLTIIANDYRWAQAVPFLGLGQITEISYEFIHLRGGAQYYLDTSSSASDPRIITSAETHLGRTLAPMPYSDSYVVSAPDLKLKASAVALYQTQAQVQEIDGRITTQASSITQLQTDVAGNSSKLIVQGEAVDGLKASYVIKTDVNGLVAGYGLYNTGNTSAFGVNADYFYIGKSDAGGKKPFMVLNTSQTIGGVTYPVGTWIDVALIANATIGSAHIANASINDAHIVSLNASKITAGTIDAERIGANSISAEKLMVGDATNLWGNQHFTQVNPYPISYNNRERWVTGVNELKGNGIQMWGRDHYAPYSTKIPLKAGDTFVIEYIAGRNGGPDIPLNVGLWTYNINGNGGSAPWQFGPAEQIANLGNGWFRWRRIFVVTNAGHTLPVAYGVLYFMIEQAADEPNPAYWSVGDVTVRKGVGGELIVNGSITADKIQVGSLSAISANLGTIQVGSANIADLAVTAAHISDAAITSAKIGDLEVNTLKIANNAVSNSLASATGSALSFTSTGSPIRINVGLDHRRTSGGSANNFTDTVSLLRDGVVIKKWSFTSWWDTGNGTNTLQVKAELPMVIDTPGAGTFTYSLSGVGTKTLALLEIKK